MKKSLFIAAICLANFSIQAQGIYDVSKIPANLLPNASVVIRNETQVYEVRNPGSATYDYKIAFTILNKNGEAASNMYEYYDKFSSISSLKATTYDAKGIKIKDYKGSDFRDLSAVSGGSLYEDSRVKLIEFLQSSYPYTIEYSFSTDFSGIRSYPSWSPVSSWGYAVEQSSYVFKIPKSMSFKTLTSKDLKTDSASIKDKMEYKWSCSNVPALEKEPLSTGLKTITPWVTLAPNQFEYDNSKANIENWNTMGSWLFDLSSGSQVLPEATKAKVQSIIKDAKSPKEKIRLLYSYLQQNTRYVSVQLGIGGYKPIAAEKVAAVNYGDCKALSNFMKAMLQEAGINSNLVVIGNNMPSLNEKFTSLTQANHMILCVPMEKDTTWLECTSSYDPVGFIGNGNSGKMVLLITPDGGKLVQTPVFSATGNYMKRTAKVDIGEEGSADIQIDAKYGNAQFEDNLHMMLIEPVDQRKRIMNSLSVPNMQISSLSYTQPDKDAAVLNEKISLKSSQLLTGGGGKLFITMNLLNRQESALTTVEDRKTPFAVNYGYLDEDEVIYTIPKGYKVEFIPKDIVIESEFGRYTAKVVAKDNSLIYTRTKTVTNKKYPPEKYNEYVAFSKKIYQADKQKSILAKVD